MATTGETVRKYLDGVSCGLFEGTVSTIAMEERKSTESLAGNLAFIRKWYLNVAVHRSAQFYILCLSVMFPGLLCTPLGATGGPSPELGGQDEAASGGQHQHGCLRSE